MTQSHVSCQKCKADNKEKLLSKCSFGQGFPHGEGEIPSIRAAYVAAPAFHLEDANARRMWTSETRPWHFIAWAKKRSVHFISVLHMWTENSPENYPSDWGHMATLLTEACTRVSVSLFPVFSSLSNQRVENGIEERLLFSASPGGIMMVVSLKAGE